MITAAIDFSAELLDVREQGRRNSCLAFATTAAHERFGQHQAELCVEYLYYRAAAGLSGWTPNDGVAIDEVRAALNAYGQPSESAWPYVADHPDPWVLPEIAPPFHFAPMSSGTMTFDEIVKTLEKGLPVILGFLITRAFSTPNDNGEIDLVTGDPEIGGHAVLAVGHGTSDDGSRHLLIRNSWGIDWGVLGHAWVSERYVEHHLHETALVGR